MSEGIPYADIVILALIAGFILLRLRSVLGNKTDNGNPRYFNPLSPPVVKPEPVVQIDEKSLKPKPREETDPYIVTLADNPMVQTLDAIKVKDPQFTATRFLQGAKGAFEMVFDAFAKGDKATLKMLLLDAIFQQFSKEIDARVAQDNKSETTLVSVKAKDITDASLTGSLARVGVRFESEQVSVVRNPKGDIVEGNPSEIHHVEDHWVFERDITSKNPNWKVVET